MSKTDAAIKRVTDAIIENLAKGVPPWVAQWDHAKGRELATIRPAYNIESGKMYRGINAFALPILSGGAYQFGTYRQWALEKAKLLRAEGRNISERKGRKGSYLWNEDEGCTVGAVKKGSSSYPVIFFKMIKKEDKKNPDDSRMVPLLRYFNVFSRCQTDLPALAEAEPFEPPTDEQELVIHNELMDYMDREQVTYFEGGLQASYSPSRDRVTMPHRDAFVDISQFLGTLMHEIGHSTGHRKRLDRKMGGGFGGDEYAFEELVAELFRVLLSGHYKVWTDDNIIEDNYNSVAYLSNWAKRMKSDPRMLIRAGSRAQSALDYYLQTEFDSEAEE